jgi:hypothetical protein
VAEEFKRALSAKQVEVAKPKAKPYKLADGGGLYLLVQPSGAKLWRYKFRIHGAEGQHAIGVYPTVSLSKAREQHGVARTLVTMGTNPNHARKQAKLEANQARVRDTHGAFSSVVRSWRSATDQDLRPSSVRQRERELDKDVLPFLHDRQID